MKYLNRKDFRKRKTIFKFELDRLLLKSINRNLKLNVNIRDNAFIILSNLSKNSSYIKGRNRCLITCRSRSILHKYRISRIVYKQMAMQKRLPSGVSYAVW